MSAGVQRVAVGAGQVWTTNSTNNTLTRIDPATNRITASTRMPGTPLGLALGGGRVWVTIARSGRNTTPAPPACPRTRP